jgi:hypothetical protein
MLQAEVETHILMADGKFKFKIDINRHGPRLIHDTSPHLDPPYYSLPKNYL